MVAILTQSSVMGIPVHLSQDYHSWLRSRLDQHLGTHVITLNPEMVMLARSQPILANIIQKAELVVADGAGIVFYCRLHGKKQPRFPGIEMAESLLQYAGTRDSPCSVFFYGGKTGIAQQAAETWKQRAPQLEISTAHGYLTHTEVEALLTTLQEKQPQIILVALGVPRQEEWITQHRHLCPNSIWIGVGGSFDIWAGVKSRAPEWMNRYYLEWLYRLYQEPWRWRRMLVLPKFALMALRGK
jgi:N-acetylglucosaminyldiphosphoundecaprenol N-acetyl-beta-D-mannosaminyltransferase